VTRECCAGTDLDALLADDIRLLDGRANDADVRVGGGTTPLPLRRVGVQTPKGEGCFRTSLPPRIGPRQLADRNRVRWEAECSRKLDQSVHRLDQIDAERPCSLNTLLHASLVASTIAAVLAHRPNLNIRQTAEVSIVVSGAHFRYEAGVMPQVSLGSGVTARIVGVSPLGNTLTLSVAVDSTAPLTSCTLTVTNPECSMGSKSNVMTIVPQTSVRPLSPPVERPVDEAPSPSTPSTGETAPPRRRTRPRGER
jgi:hypothetical protein